MILKVTTLNPNGTVKHVYQLDRHGVKAQDIMKCLNAEEISLLKDSGKFELKLENETVIYEIY